MPYNGVIGVFLSTYKFCFRR